MERNAKARIEHAQQVLFLIDFYQTLIFKFLFLLQQIMLLKLAAASPTVATTTNEPHMSSDISCRTALKVISIFQLLFEQLFKCKNKLFSLLLSNQRRCQTSLNYKRAI